MIGYVEVHPTTNIIAAMEEPLGQKHECRFIEMNFHNVVYTRMIFKNRVFLNVILVLVV